MQPTDRVRAALGSRYRIERELGAGGMATVYLATDLKHEREVAIKVFRQDLAAVLGAERFLAEVKISASLDHPHILTLIDSGETDGLLYYVMPFVRGETLRTRLDREKQLGIADALQITSQVAGALDYAHAKGVVHRDIKPENILIHQGVAVLADFGIALAVQQSGGDRLTETGLSLGTPRYMSPEQATGDRQLDARSDVYSLAAVLYEMLGGEAPVTGATAQAMIAKLLTEKPLSLRVVRDAVSPALDAAVLRGLSKVPADRFDSAGALAAAAQQAGTSTDQSVAATPIPRRRLALLAIPVAIVAVALGGWLALGRGGGTDAYRFAGAVLTPLTTSGRAFGPVPSPDGTQFAYTETRCEGTACRGDLMIRELDGDGQAALQADPNRDAYAAGWSPDGRWLLVGLLNTEENRIEGYQVVSQRGGGTPRRITGTTAAAFVANDTIVSISMGGPPYYLRRHLVSDGTVVDSVVLAVARYGFATLAATVSGRWLMVGLVPVNPSDSVLFLVVDRDGTPTDTLVSRMALIDRSQRDALLLQERPGDGTAPRVVRRRIDRRGRLGTAASIASFDPSAVPVSISADGTTLYFNLDRAGETTRWTAIRRSTTEPFSMARVLSVGTNYAATPLSPRGGWIVRGLRAVGGRAPAIEVERFAGGDPVVLDPGLTTYMDVAFAPGDDSVAMAVAEGTDRVALTIYPLPGGAPVRLGTYPGGGFDLEWLADGRLASPVGDGRAVRVFARSGEAVDHAFPDSLGMIQGAARSPEGPELALLSVSGISTEGIELRLSRMDMGTGQVRSVGGLRGYFLTSNRVWWGSDGQIRFAVQVFPALQHVVYKVPLSGGPITVEPPLTFAPNGGVTHLSHDALRAAVSATSRTTDIAVMRAVGMKR